MAIQRRCIQVACEELNFVWDEDQLLELADRWIEGATIQQLAKLYRRKREEVVIALLDRLDETQKAAMFNRWGMIPRKEKKQVNVI